MKKIIMLTLVSVYSFGCKAQPVKLEASKTSNTLLWEISGKGLKKPSYLFGTFHLICKEDLPFSKNLEKAIASTAATYFEMDMDDPAVKQGGLGMVMLKGDSALKDFYTSIEYKRLNEFVKDSIGIPLALFKKMKPITIEAMVYTKMLHCDIPTSTEDALMNIAKKYNKEIKGFETMQFQASVMNGIPDTTQAKNLLAIADSFSQFKTYFNKTLQLYKTQFIDSLLATSTEYDFGDEDAMDALLYNRNKNWVKQLKLIFTKENVFVAVGAAHLAGKMGLIQLLKKEGYTVRPIKNF